MPRILAAAESASYKITAIPNSPATTVVAMSTERSVKRWPSLRKATPATAKMRAGYQRGKYTTPCRYRIAAATGFRASELRSLTPVAFKLREATPIIVVEGAYTKNGDVANQPICPDLAAELIKWLRGKPEGEPIWPGEWHKKAAEMLRVDLESAKVAFRTDRGVLDFHAIRATYITGLARAGVHPRYAQQLARHKSMDLTMKTYTLLELEEVAAKLPKVM